MRDTYQERQHMQERRPIHGMPKSSRRSTDVNVISADVQRSSKRRAKIAFVAAGLITWALSALVLASYMNSILAVLVAVLVAAPVAFVVFVAVLVWPVVRILVHWSVELVAGSVLLSGMAGLYHLLAGPVVVLVLLALVGGLMLPPALRHRTTSWAWCAISRHRLVGPIRPGEPAHLAVRPNGSTPHTAT